VGFVLYNGKMDWFDFIKEVGFAIATASILLWFLINTVNTQINKIISLLNEITNRLGHLDQISKIDDKVDRLTYMVEDLKVSAEEAKIVLKALQLQTK
jgi:hypothetical protein